VEPLCRGPTQLKTLKNKVGRSNKKREMDSTASLPWASDGETGASGTMQQLERTKPRKKLAHF
jgi:hypothetical protein